MSGPQSKMCVFKTNSNAIFIVEKNWVPLLLPNTWGDCFEQSTAQPIFNDKSRGCQKIGECFYGWGTRTEKKINFLQIMSLLQSYVAPLQNLMGFG